MSHPVQQLKSTRVPACRLAPGAVASLGGAVFGAVACSAGPVADPVASLDYSVVDPEVRLERLDSSPKESFLSMRVDSAGRLFVGGREACSFTSRGRRPIRPAAGVAAVPADSWVYDIEIRGNDLYVLTLSALYVVPDGVVKRQGLDAQAAAVGRAAVSRAPMLSCAGLGAGGRSLHLDGGHARPLRGFRSRPIIGDIGPFSRRRSKTAIPYTGQGAVLRMHPDGSGLQVVARGCATVAAWSSITIGTSSATTTITSRCRWRTFPAG